MTVLKFKCRKMIVIRVQFILFQGMIDILNLDEFLYCGVHFA